MLAEDDKCVEGLIEYLHDALLSGETLSESIINFYGHAQKTQETEEAFGDDIQVMARKMIAGKQSFCLEANQQLKAQYAYKLWDLYYATMVHSALQSSLEEETF